MALADAAETELKDRLGERRLRAHCGASSHVDRRRKQDEVNEVASGNRQVGNFRRVNDLTDLRFLGVDSLNRRLHLYFFLDRDAHGHLERGNLTHRQGDHHLLRGKSLRVGGQFIIARRKPGNHRQSMRLRYVCPLRARLPVGDRHGCTRDDCPGLIADCRLQHRQFLGVQSAREHQNQ